VPHPSNEGYTAGLVYHPRRGVGVASMAMHIYPGRTCLKHINATPKAGTSLNPSIHPFIHPSIHQSINQSINQSVNQSVNQSINQSINQSMPSI